MSTSLLYHAFGISGTTTIEPSKKVVQLYFAYASLTCRSNAPSVGGQEVIKKGSTVRRLRTVPIGRKAVFIECKIPRVACYQCRLVRQVQVEFADPRRTYTNAFKRYALELSK